LMGALFQLKIGVKEEKQLTQGSLEVVMTT
jgi:hypothetical protein